MAATDLDWPRIRHDCLIVAWCLLRHDEDAEDVAQQACLETLTQPRPSLWVALLKARSRAIDRLRLRRSDRGGRGRRPDEDLVGDALPELDVVRGAATPEDLTASRRDLALVLSALSGEQLEAAVRADGCGAAVPDGLLLVLREAGAAVGRTPPMVTRWRRGGTGGSSNAGRVCAAPEIATKSAKIGAR